MTDEVTKDTAAESAVERRQQVFAEQIAPLLKEVHSLCQDHGIAMAAGFSLGEVGGRIPCVAVKSLPEGVELPVNMQLAFLLLESPQKMMESLASLAAAQPQAGGRLTRPGASRLVH